MRTLGTQTSKLKKPPRESCPQAQCPEVQWPCGHAADAFLSARVHFGTWMELTSGAERRRTLRYRLLEPLPTKMPGDRSPGILFA